MTPGENSMRKINLQMFAMDPNSIVDYLKSTGQDSSYSARKELAASLGISNYSGTAEQNTQMLNSMKNKNTSPSASSGGDSKKNTSSGTNGPSPSSSGPSQSPSNRGGIVSQDVWDIIDTSFSPSTAYKDAMNYTNGLLQQLSSGRTSFTDQIKDVLNDIQNRDKFSYDLSNDSLFQQSLASAMASGKTAMQDTMGQASALTGGYGSTYATSAANQQYNAFIEDAYNNLPEYYEMALQAYEMEGNEMYKQLAALNDADETEYERLYNSWSANAQTAQQMYQNEYTAWADSVSNAMELAGLQMDEFSTMFDADFSYAQLAQDQKQFEANLAAKKGSGNGGDIEDVNKKKPKSDPVDSTDVVNNVRAWMNIGDMDDYDAYDYVMQLMEDGKIDDSVAKNILDQLEINWVAVDNREDLINRSKSRG
jgi:hypothetical protein